MVVIANFWGIRLLAFSKGVEVVGLTVDVTTANFKNAADALRGGLCVLIWYISD